MVSKSGESCRVVSKSIEKRALACPGAKATEMVKTMKDRERGCKDALVRGRQKINERRENTGNNMNRHENPKTNAKEEVYEEKKRKGPEAKLKRLRNQKSKLSEERELLDKCDGLATAAGTTELLYVVYT